MKNGKIKVVSGEIMVTDPIDGGNYATITPSTVGVLKINGICKKSTTFVKASDIIEYVIDDKEVEKKILINTSKDKLRSYITIENKKIFKGKIKDEDESESLEIQVIEEVEKIYEKNNKEDIFRYLNDEGIVYGVINEAIDEIINDENDIYELLIAEGDSPIDAKDDTVEFVFQKENEKNTDFLDRVDYKNLNKISSISEGETIGIIHYGNDAVLGKDVFGEEVKSKKNKRKIVRSGNGCKIMDDSIIAEIGGQVSFKNGIVSVNKVYKVLSDIDISTGNINFHGDVDIQGNVNEGMMVCAQNNININGGVFGSDIIANGEIYIQGSIASSRIVAGGNDIVKQKRINLLEEFLKNFENLIESIEFLNEKNVIKNEGDLVVVIHKLIESKFKNFNKQSMEVIGSAIKDGDKNSLVVRFIKNKLLPISICNIKSIDELKSAIVLIVEEISFLKEYLKNVSKVTINYCQEGKIQSSGDIVINGKGIFSTDLFAANNIIFTDMNSVCRGGSLKAVSSITAATVGSEAEAQTVIEVFDKKGIVTIEKAYGNTMIIINNKRYLINKPCRNVKGYINNKGELSIDKFTL